MFNARADDSGQYEFKVENEFGEETALIDVRVRTEPSRPKGPLRSVRVLCRAYTAQ